MKINTKEQIMVDFGVAVGSEFKNALKEGKELSVEDLLKIQKDKWSIRGGGDMMEFYKSVGISEQDVRDEIGKTIEYWKNKREDDK